MNFVFNKTEFIVEICTMYMHNSFNRFDSYRFHKKVICNFLLLF